MFDRLLDDFEDDRHRPLPSVPRDLLVQTIWRDAPVPIRATRIPHLAKIACLLFFVFAAIWLGRFPNIIRHFACWIYGAFFLVIVGLMIRRLLGGSGKAAGTLRREQRRRVIALVAAYGRCGACGYDLESVPPDADGCATCPECAAAWSLDRATMRTRDPRTDPVLARALRTPVLFAEHALSTDDRHVPLDSPRFSSRRWLRADHRGREFWRPRVEHWLESRSWLRSLVTQGTLILWFIGVCAFIATRPSHAGDLVDLLIFALLTGFVALAVVVVAWRTGNARQRAKALILAAHVCPNCHADLPDEKYTHPTFDRCLACTTCGRAWRLPGDA